MRRVLSALLLSLATLLPHAATADALTDSWWVPEESGWGLATVHERDLLTLTLYVHDASGAPRWLSAALRRYGNTQAGDPEFSGVLVETRGSAPSTPWDPAAAVSRGVGDIAFRARPGGRAELEYTVDGVRVRKDIQRLATQAARITGLHLAMLLPSYDSCPVDFVGLSTFERGTLYIEPCETCEPDAAGGQPLSLDLLDGSREICHIDGHFRRHGSSGEIDGRYRCADGGEGPIRLRDIEFNSTGFSARFSTSHTRCGEFSGILSAVRSDARQ